MLEVELKYRVADALSLESLLQRLGAEFVETRDDVDRYFSAPDRNFATTDEAVRIRQAGDQNFLTYKGPKLDTRTKTRSELEVPLAAGSTVADLAVQWLTAIRYQPAGEVRKRRDRYRLPREQFHVEICHDEVEKLGHYLELEILADESQLSQATEVLLHLAKELGLNDTERRSYLQLLREVSEVNRSDQE